MKNEVISAAGNLRNLLSDKGEINISAVPRLMKEKSVIVYQAVGWLAREDKISYRSHGDKVFVSLSEK